MTRWWTGLALIALGLVSPAAARAQYQFGYASPEAMAGPGPTDPTPLQASGSYGYNYNYNSDDKKPLKVSKDGSAPPVGLTDDGSGNAFVKGSPICEADSCVLWFSGEYLNWHFSRDRANVVLVTTSTNPDLNTDFGALGQPGTVVLFGNSNLDYGSLDGARFTVGFNLGWEPHFEVTGFFGNRNKNLFFVDAGPTGEQLFARPILAAQLAGAFNNGQEVAFLASFPSAATGTITIDSTSNFWGVQGDVIMPVTRTEVFFMDLNFSYRRLELNESLSITNTLTPIDPAFVIPFKGDPNGFGTGFTSTANDLFRTRNRFDGGQIGARVGGVFGPVAVYLDSRLGFGQTQQHLQVRGFSTLTTPTTATRGLVFTAPGGILAVPSNSGNFSRSEFTVLPETALSLGIEVTPWLKILGSYNLIYWSSVIRPGQQLNNVVDTRQVPTDFQFDPTARPSGPLPSFRTSEFWAHGLSIGVLFSF